MIATSKLVALVAVFVAFQLETVSGHSANKLHTDSQETVLSMADLMIHRATLEEPAKKKNNDYGSSSSGNAADYGSSMDQEQNEAEKTAGDSDYGSNGAGSEDEEKEKEEEEAVIAAEDAIEEESNEADEDDAGAADDYGSERVDAMVRLSKEVLAAAEKLAPRDGETKTADDGHYCAECCPLAPTCEGEKSAVLEAHSPRDDGCICCSWKCLGASEPVQESNQITQKVGDMWPEKKTEHSSAHTNSLACLAGAAVVTATLILLR